MSLQRLIAHLYLQWLIIILLLLLLWHAVNVAARLVMILRYFLLSFLILETVPILLLIWIILWNIWLCTLSENLFVIINLCKVVVFYLVDYLLILHILLLFICELVMKLLLEIVRVVSLVLFGKRL